MAEIHFVEETGSTNADARALAEAGAAHGTAVVAARQTAGRGRLGRVWESPAGGLYLSVILRPRLAPTRAPLVCLGAAVAAAEACGPDVRVKWPNDLQVPDGRKLGGILAEMDIDSGQLAWVVIGIGINLTEAPEGACLAELGGADRTQLAHAVRDGIVAVCGELEAGGEGVLHRWRARSATLGHRVRVGEVVGIAENIGRDGALLVRTVGGLRRVLAGDVEMVSRSRS